MRIIVKFKINLDRKISLGSYVGTIVKFRAKKKKKKNLGPNVKMLSSLMINLDKKRIMSQYEKSYQNLKNIFYPYILYIIIFILHQLNN